MAEFYVKLLGAVYVEHNGRSLKGFRSQKTLALLGYLAVEARPVSRDLLAGLFWGDEPQSEARGELRRSLHNLSGLLPGCFQADRRTIHFDPPASCQVDIHVFQTLQAQADVESLAQAIALFQGPFMEGIYLDGCPEFETWLLAERERWRQQVTRLHHRLIGHYETQNDLTPAIQFARQLLTVDPWQEDTQRRLMLLLARSGQWRAALAQYDTYRHMLAEELDVEPDEATTALFQRLKTAAATPRHNLPNLPTPFVGREAELAQIDQALVSPDCRLLTLVGPGGIGKTRLALQSAPGVVDNFLEGVCFVSLVSINTTDGFVTAISDALNFAPATIENHQAQLIDYLRQKALLLLLDNAESLIDSGCTNLIARILASAPEVKILATSREALNVQGEWLLTITGLTIPPAPDADIATFDAVQLFTRCARRIKPDFNWAGKETAVTHICQLVEGMPLGLELAAGWLKLLSCSEIAVEIERSLDILTTAHQDMPARHQSLRAVFESSWARLSPDEQTTLAKLSCFRGTFTRTASSQIIFESETAADLFPLAELVDKSLLHLNQSSAKETRYELHELLRQFAAEKLAAMPDIQADVERKHGRYYMRFLGQWEKTLHEANRQEAIEAIHQNIENIRAAWQWAQTQGIWAEIADALEALHLFYELRGWHQEGEKVFGLTSTKLAGAIKETEQRLYARLVGRQGWHAWRMGQYTEAQQMAEQSLASAQTLADNWNIAFAECLLGLVRQAQGDYATARQRYENSLTLWRELGEQWGTAVALFNLGLIYQATGQYQQAVQPYQEGLAIFKEVGYQFGATTAVGELGRLARRFGDYGQARELCQESLAAHREMNDPWGVAAASENLGSIACGLLQLDEARAHFKTSIAIRRQLGDQYGLANAYDQLGQVAFAQEQYAKAEQHCRQSLLIRRQLGDRKGTAVTLNNLGLMAHLQDKNRVAEQFLGESLALYRALGNQAGMAAALNNLGSVVTALGHFDAAQAHFTDAFRLAISIEALPLALDVMVGWAHLLHQAGNDDKAAKLLSIVLQHPTGNEALEAKAQRLLPALTAVSDPTELGTAVVDFELTSEAIDLETAVNILLDIKK